MNKIVAISGFVFLAGCAQYTTSDEERAVLSSTAESKAEAYLQCVQRQSQQVLGLSRDAAFVVERAQAACQTELESYKTAESEFLSTQYMRTDKEVEAAVAQLDEKSKSAVTEMLMNNPANTAGTVPAAPAAAARPSPPRPAPGAAAAGASAAGRASVPSGFTPAFDQRVYLDCMRDQAGKYVRLNETAAAIAEVAASRCRAHLVGANQPALEQEGRALVMGTVFDARLEAGGS